MPLLVWSKHIRFVNGVHNCCSVNLNLNINSYFYRTPSWLAHRKIRLREGIVFFQLLKYKFKCGKKWIYKGTWRQMFICLRPRTPYPSTHCLRVYSVLIHTGKGGRGGESWTREKVRGAQSICRSISLDERHFALVSILWGAHVNWEPDAQSIKVFFFKST